ncbi:unnamed protein product [Laminaria digitata]
MEDSHTIITNVAGLEGHSFVAIYDGHGGALCAAYAGEHMMQHIADTDEFAAYSESAEKDTGLLEKAMYAAFLSCDRAIKVDQDRY